MVDLLQKGDKYTPMCFLGVGVMFSMIEGMDALTWQLSPLQVSVNDVLNCHSIYILTAMCLPSADAGHIR